MSEETTSEKGEAQKETTEKEVDWKAEAEKWKNLSRKNEDAAEKATAKVTQLEEATKSELQKALDRADAAEKKAAELEAKDQVAAWAKEIVKDSQVPASALRGNTREELEAHFKDLEALIPKPQQQKRTAVPAGKPTGTEGGSAAVSALRQFRNSQ